MNSDIIIINYFKKKKNKIYKMFRNSENTKKIEYTFYTPHVELNQNPGNNNPQKKVILDFL